METTPVRSESMNLCACALVRGRGTSDHGENVGQYPGGRGGAGRILQRLLFYPLGKNPCPERGPGAIRGKGLVCGKEIAAFGRGGLTDYKAAAQRHNQFAQAMKKADPSIQLVASTGLIEEWDDGFLKENPPFDLLSYHCYLYDRFPGKEQVQQVVKAAVYLCISIVKGFP